jgi:hypothetical protein
VGIAQVLALSVRPLLASGDLVEIFPDWPGETFLCMLSAVTSLPPTPNQYQTLERSLFVPA